MRSRSLSTPPLPRLVPDAVFDAFAWCESSTLEWRRPEGRWDSSSLDQAENPSGMVFVMHEGTGEFLPRELARLHAFGYGLENEWALAPYAIDDATDLLYEERTTPNEALWLAADGLRALTWGLHDWAHFHNHGPFEERAWTELQCDASALAWLWINRAQLPEFNDDEWERARVAISQIAKTRFDEEKKIFDSNWLSRDELLRIAVKISGS